MNYQFDFHFLGGSLPALLDGLKVTLELALVSNLIGLVAGFGLSLMTLVSLNQTSAVESERR
ncbi:hypothetical protein [Pseudomonas aeruginosa]|uniref:hypothetical protein n=1 Tax=Pseudomonas aeruginosa TaxID=287 RepID=UPI00066E2849|nr:hypothetical protein [Pseudomonas aeruginosa]